MSQSPKHFQKCRPDGSYVVYRAGSYTAGDTNTPPPTASRSGAVIYPPYRSVKTKAPNGAQPSPDVMINNQQVMPHASKAIPLTEKKIEDGIVIDQTTSDNEGYVYDNPCCETVPLIQILNDRLKQAGIIPEDQEINYKKMMGCAGMGDARYDSTSSPIPISNTSFLDDNSPNKTTFISGGNFSLQAAPPPPPPPSKGSPIPMYRPAGEEGPKMTDACSNVLAEFFQENANNRPCNCIPVINDDECAQFLEDGTFGEGVVECECFAEKGARIIPLIRPPGSANDPKLLIDYIIKRLNDGSHVPMHTNGDPENGHPNGNNSNDFQNMTHFLNNMLTMQTYNEDGTLSGTTMLDHIGDTLGADAKQKLTDLYNDQVATGSPINITELMNDSDLMGTLNEQMKGPQGADHHFTASGYTYNEETGVYTLELDLGFGGGPGSTVTIDIDPNDLEGFDPGILVKTKGAVDFQIEECDCGSGTDCSDSESNCELVCCECSGSEPVSISINLIEIGDPNATCESLGYNDAGDCVTDPPCYSASSLLVDVKDLLP